MLYIFLIKCLIPPNLKKETIMFLAFILRSGLAFPNLYRSDFPRKKVYGGSCTG